MKIHTGNEKWNRAAAIYVRMEVFVLERGITLEEEFDALDDDFRVYVVAFDANKPVATGRYIKEDDFTVRPGRIATLNEYRGQGLGKRVLKEIEKIAASDGCTSSVIHGELTAAGFYEKLGYKRTSGIFYEDGVECVQLVKEL